VFFWQTIFIAPYEAFVCLMLDAGLSILDIEKRMLLILSSIEYPKSSILLYMAQTLMPMIVSSLILACLG